VRRPCEGAPTAKQRNSTVKDLYDLAETPAPPLGQVPARMHAYVVRQTRFGPPRDAWKRESSHAGDRPRRGARLRDGLRHQLQQRVGGNSAIRSTSSAERRSGEPEDFHAGGSDCSASCGRSARTCANARSRRGHRPQRLVAADDPWMKSGKDPMAGESTRIWGYQTNSDRSVSSRERKAHQCVARPRRLTGKSPGAFSLRLDGVPGCSWAGRRTPSRRVTPCWCGGRRRSRQHGALRDHARGRRAHDRRGIERRQAQVLHGSRRGRGGQSHAVHPLGQDAGTPVTQGLRRVGQGSARLRQAIWDALAIA